LIGQIDEFSHLFDFSVASLQNIEIDSVAIFRSPRKFFESGVGLIDLMLDEYLWNQ